MEAEKRHLLPSHSPPMCIFMLQQQHYQRKNLSLQERRADCQRAVKDDGKGTKHIAKECIFAGTHDWLQFEVVAGRHFWPSLSMTTLK